MQRVGWPVFRRKRSDATEGWVWRHELAPPPKTSRFGKREIELDRAWRSLLLIHTSFRAPDQGEYRELIEGLRAMEMVFMQRPELGPYYDECNRPIGEPVNVTAASSGVARHMAAVQARFMERVYFVLELARYSNALDNRGWMNLFRGWAQSTTFSSVFKTLRSTLTAEFVDFYDLYITGAAGPIESYPVRHPWDAEIDTRRVASGVFLDSGRHALGPMPSPGSRTQGIVDEYTRSLGAQHQPDVKLGADASSASGPPNA
jgi:hypothetical protein